MCADDLSAYPVQPDQLVGDGVGPHVALEVDIVARPQVIGVQALAQPQRHPRLVCKHRDWSYTSSHSVTIRQTFHVLCEWEN